MPFPFELPTTSSISFDDFYISTTHPSLPLAATTCRGVLRDVLKKHKRLPPPSQTSDLPAVATALNEYIPHLSALDAGLSNSNSNSNTAAASEAINVAPLPRGELAVEWRATLTAPQMPGRDPPRIKLRGLRLELGFALASLAYVHSLQARAALHALYNYNSAAAPPSSEQRTAAVAAAMRAFLEANAIHTYLVQRLGSINANGTSPPPAAPPQPTSSNNDGSKRPPPSSAPPPTAIPPDMTPGVQTALAELTLAEATLIAVLKDDPYPAVVAEDRSRASRDWMFKAPDIPRVRAHLFARLCLAAAEHAARGKAGLGWAAGGSAAAAGKVDEALGRYLEDLRRTARGKACRFFGIDAELEGKAGEAIAWLRAARRELGFSSGGGGGGGGVSGGAGEEEGGGSSKGRGFASKLKKDWSERREDRKIEKGADWGSDAGRFEEGRVVDMLEKKWVKMNDTVGVQTIPPIEPLLASMPSGREYHSPKAYKLPQLDESTIARMRAPPNPSEVTSGGVDDSSSDDDREESRRRAAGGGNPIGAFPGTSGDYAADAGGDREGYY
ncbi:ph-response regulator protein palc [Diplodia corticola]|uniref:pH-response regulator protein palC n=1 Tax=Diplodia corticola TaxID=236234 RepID=A0A1J9S2H4_9PEZI|nr:ph-response regulator protein palc [Diplodia corticola]OJD33845.1 ph-response regulator protein palc [Diplodia corticola]